MSRRTHSTQSPSDNPIWNKPIFTKDQDIILLNKLWRGGIFYVTLQNQLLDFVWRLRLLRWYWYSITNVKTWKQSPQWIGEDRDVFPPSHSLHIRETSLCHQRDRSTTTALMQRAPWARIAGTGHLLQSNWPGLEFAVRGWITTFLVLPTATEIIHSLGAIPGKEWQGSKLQGNGTDSALGLWPEV